jgi:hypothetical protein
VRSLRRSTVIIAAVVLLACVGNAAAGAARLPSGGSPSRYGAGDFSQPAEGVLSVSTTFKVPKITCATSADVETLAPGLMLITNSGSVTTTVGLDATCDTGSVSYATHVCVAATVCVDGDAKPGDTLVVKLTNNNVSGTTGTIRNVRSGTVTTSTAAFSPFNIYALVGVVAPSFVDGASAVPTFRSISFTKARINGTRIGNASHESLSLESSNDVQIKTSKLTPTGATFKTTFVTND